MSSAILSLPQDWQVFESPALMARTVVDEIVLCANQAIAEKGRFDFVTAGGTTPNLVYSLLAELEKSTPTISDWSKWFIYLGDERVLPAGDSERNSQMLEQHWLVASQIPAKNRIYMPTEKGLEAAADYYRQAISGVDFDVVLLGMGEDGHTASLFPNHTCVSLGGVVCEKQSPKPPSERLSLSYERLSSAATVIKLITGRSKSNAVHAWLEGEDLPISRVIGAQTTKVYLDIEATAVA